MMITSLAADDDGWYCPPQTLFSSFPRHTRVFARQFSSLNCSKSPDSLPRHLPTDHGPAPTPPPVSPIYFPMVHIRVLQLQSHSGHSVGRPLKRVEQVPFLSLVGGHHDFVLGPPLDFPFCRRTPVSHSFLLVLFLGIPNPPLYPYRVAI